MVVSIYVKINVICLKIRDNLWKLEQSSKQKQFIFSSVHFSCSWLLSKTRFDVPEGWGEVVKRAPWCCHDVQHFLLYGDQPPSSILLWILLMPYPDPLTSKLMVKLFFLALKISNN